MISSALQYSKTTHHIIIVNNYNNVHCYNQPHSIHSNTMQLTLRYPLTGILLVHLHVLAYMKM